MYMHTARHKKQKETTKQSHTDLTTLMEQFQTTLLDIVEATWPTSSLFLLPLPHTSTMPRNVPTKNAHGTWSQNFAGIINGP